MLTASKNNLPVKTRLFQAWTECKCVEIRSNNLIQDYWVSCDLVLGNTRDIGLHSRDFHLLSFFLLVMCEYMERGAGFTASTHALILGT